jgi:hypothetical protein
MSGTFAGTVEIKVNVSDLAVSEPALVELKRGFQRHGIFLEVKEGSRPGSKGVVSIKKERLAQIFVASKDSGGSVDAKGKQKLFADGQAIERFRHHADSPERLLDAIALVKIDTLMNLKSPPLFKGVRTKNRAKHATFAAQSTYVLALKATDQWSGLRESLARDDAFRKSPFAKVVRGHLRSATMLLLGQSKGHADSAFYKNKELVSKAVERVARKLQKELRGTFE